MYKLVLNSTFMQLTIITISLDYSSLYYVAHKKSSALADEVTNKEITINMITLSPLPYGGSSTCF